MTTNKDDTFHGFTIEDIRDLATEYKVLGAKHDMLIKKDELSRSLIKDLKSDIATQKKKVELVEKEIKELKSQDVAKELSKKSLQEVDDEKAKLKFKTLEQKNKINNLTSEVHRLQSQIKQSEENHQNEVRGLKAEKTNLNQKLESRNSSLVKQFGEEKNKCRGVESQLADVQKSLESKNVENQDLRSKVTKLEKKLNYLGPDLFGHMENKVMVLEKKLNEQKKFVLGADVQKTIDEIEEAHKEMLSVMEKKHNMEKLAIRMDGENKGRILLELQKMVHDLNAQNYMMSQSL